MYSCNKNYGREVLRLSGRIRNYFMKGSVKDKTGWMGRTLPAGDRKKIAQAMAASYLEKTKNEQTNILKELSQV